MHFILTLLSLFPVVSDIDKPAPTDISKELIGVWSGLLFQTESKYDSIAVFPADDPNSVILFKNGEESHYELEEFEDHYRFRGEGGLRFDSKIEDNSANFFGVLTYNLWSQGLVFTQKGNRWVSEIVKHEIIDTDYNVYLEFYEDSTGQLQANIQSNKENRELHFTIKSLQVNNNSISFDITNDRFSITAKFDPTENAIKLTYQNPGGSRTIDLEKLQPHQLLGYKPLSKGQYYYSIPDPLDSSIQSASIEEVGINNSMLGLMSEFESGEFDHIHSIIVTRNNKLVFEEYFHGYNRESLHDIKSSFKSIASLMLGIAMMEDSSIQLNNSILDYYSDYNFSDTNKENITIHHALTMSTGLQLENEDVMQSENFDWVGYKLSLPMAHQAGKVYEYSSGGMNLLTGVIQSSSNKYLPLYLFEEILIPMGIYEFQMRSSPYGRAYLPGDFYLRPIDLTKFGLLVLNNGIWNNEPLLESEWITVSTESQIESSWPINSGYGYLWRILKRNVGGKPMKTIEAWGNGGQFLIIIPEANMTITFTGGNYNLFPEMEDKPFSLLENYILPAVELRN